MTNNNDNSTNLGSNNATLAPFQPRPSSANNNVVLPSINTILSSTNTVRPPLPDQSHQVVIPNQQVFPGQTPLGTNEFRTAKGDIFKVPEDGDFRLDRRNTAGTFFYDFF